MQDMTSQETTHAAGPAVPFTCVPYRDLLTALFDFLVDQRVKLTALLLVGLIVRSVLLDLPGRVFAASSAPATFLGYLLVLAGIALRSWAAGVLPKGRGLATHGPYRWCRHPLYLGSMLALTGFALLALDALGMGVLGLVLGVLYGATIWREEQRLACKFGVAWAAYQTRTPCLFGWRLPADLGHWSIQQWRRSREYRALVSALFGLIAVTCWLVHF
jgi:protein-S-isoprenylcysteine O-methyltransferase Ste14